MLAEWDNEIICYTYSMEFSYYFTEDLCWKLDKWFKKINEKNHQYPSPLSLYNLPLTHPAFLHNSVVSGRGLIDFTTSK